MWLKVLSESTKNGREGLDTASFKYNFVLDEEVITAIHHVRNMYYVDALISSKVYGEPIRTINDHDSMSVQIPLGNLADDKFYFEYINWLTRLKELIDLYS